MSTRYRALTNINWIFGMGPGGVIVANRVIEPSGAAGTWIWSQYGAGWIAAGAAEAVASSEPLTFPEDGSDDRDRLDRYARTEDLLGRPFGTSTAFETRLAAAAAR